MINNYLAGIMSHSTITLSRKDKVNEVRKIFREKNIHHIPIVDENNRLEGIVSLVDYAIILDSMTPFGNRQTQEENKKVFESFLVEDIMTKNVVTLNAEDSAQAALELFKENLFHAIPIVDDNHKLLGIVTTYDLLMLLWKRHMKVSKLIN